MRTPSHVPGVEVTQAELEEAGAGAPDGGDASTSDFDGGAAASEFGTNFYSATLDGGTA